MKINLLYQGAVREYFRQHHLSDCNSIKPQPFAGKKEIEVERDGKAYKLTLSEEVKCLNLKVITEEELAEMDMLTVKPDPSDIFSYRPQDQWLIFSQYLNDSGFFGGKDLSAIEEIENILVDITDGLDSLDISKPKGRDFKSGSRSIGKELSSTEAQLELAASVSALKLFSEKYLTGDTKKGFDELIDKYAKRNEKLVINYSSTEEKFYKARAKILEARNINTSSLNTSQKKNLDITNKLGKTNFTTAEILDVIESYKEKFSLINSKLDVEVIISQIKKQFLQFATKGISPNDKNYIEAQNFIEEKSEDTFERIKAYWNKILG